jgi:cytochrome c-type biogenesis protein
MPTWFGSLREKVQTKGLIGALLLGLISGLVSSQCATPVLAAILTYVMAQKTGILYGAVLLFIYALGRGVPILLAGSFTGILKGFRSLGNWSGWLEKASGVIILLVGFYFLWIA